METFGFFNGLVKKNNQELRFNTSVYDQKREGGLRYSAAQDKLPELKEEIFPAGQGPIMCRGFLSELEKGSITHQVQTNLPHTRAGSHQPWKQQGVSATRKSQVYEL